MIHVGILGSTRGSSMLPIMDAIRQKRLFAQIDIVISNKQDAVILQNAAKHQLPTQFIDPKNLTREEYDQLVSDTLHQHHVELVVLIGYMRILSDKFVSEWKNKIINVHPSLLPAFAGGMDLDVHRAVLASGVKESGCTVHIVTKEVDAGPIVIQKKCPVLADDTPETLKARVQALEGEALVDGIMFCSSSNFE
jgi:phosphoribosylglycinamide formyltransferase-1